MLPRKRHRMLQSILELEDMSFDDVMVPHNEVEGIDLDGDWEHVVETIRQSRYRRLPVFRDSIDHVIGVLDLQRLIPSEGLTTFNINDLMSLVDEPYYVPEGTPLHQQLIQFQTMKMRLALVVDEYGDIQGLVTLEDILEEIVGDFTASNSPAHADVTADLATQSYVVNAAANVRSLNRTMNWNLPVNEAKTLNGLIQEELEDIPENGTGLQLGDYNVEILQTSENAINLVRIRTPEMNS